MTAELAIKTFITLKRGGCIEMQSWMDSPGSLCADHRARKSIMKSQVFMEKYCRYNYFVIIILSLDSICTPGSMDPMNASLHKSGFTLNPSSRGKWLTY